MNVPNNGGFIMLCRQDIGSIGVAFGHHQHRLFLATLDMQQTEASFHIPETLFVLVWG
jgi:hypothetical protein